MIHYLINLVVFEKLNMQFIDVVTAYLYEDVNTEIHMKIPEELKIPDLNSCRTWNTLSISLRCSLYGLKQSREKWYTRPSEYLIRMRYK